MRFFLFCVSDGLFSVRVTGRATMGYERCLDTASSSRRPPTDGAHSGWRTGQGSRQTSRLFPRLLARRRKRKPAPAWPPHPCGWGFGCLCLWGRRKQRDRGLSRTIRPRVVVVVMGYCSDTHGRYDLVALGSHLGRGTGAREPSGRAARRFGARLATPRRCGPARGGYRCSRVGVRRATHDGVAV